MAKTISSERRLKALIEIILSEMRTNPAFTERVDAVLNPPSSASADTQDKLPTPQAPEPSTSQDRVKRGNRRTAPLVDPLSAIQSGPQHLRDKLAPLGLEQLRDVLAEYRMDPSKLAMKWKDRERVIDHIVSTAVERGQKGDAFRA